MNPQLPLLSVPVLRPLLIRAALVCAVGAVGGILIGETSAAFTGFPVGQGLALMGLWWAGMIFFIGLSELWAERRAGDDRRRRLALTLGSAAVFGSLLLVVGGLQYQYGVGVIRGGSLEAGYRRVIRMLRFAEPEDGVLALAVLVPFVVDVVARLFLRRLVAQTGLCLLVVACVSLPLVYLQAERIGSIDQAISVQAVFLAAALFCPSSWLAGRICARRWPEEGALAVAGGDGGGVRSPVEGEAAAR